MHQPLLLPPALRPGDRIGVFTPSAPSPARYPSRYRRGLDQLRQLGFEVREGSLTASGRSQGYRMGGPRERAQELMELVLDPEVHAIVATVGGANSSSLLPWLDYDAIRAHPKILCGLSDVTSLHLAFLTRAGVSTFYGPNLMPAFTDAPMMEETRDSFLAAVTFDQAEERMLQKPKRWRREPEDWQKDEVPPLQENGGWRCVQEGRAAGPLLAAHTGTLLANAGTEVFPEFEGRVLLVEDMSATMSGLERNWRHLERLGVFDRIAGLIVGRPHDFEDEGAPFSREDLLREVLDGRQLPVVMDFDCSHTHPMLTLAQGREIRVEADRDRVEIAVRGPWVETS